MLGCKSSFSKGGYIKKSDRWDFSKDIDGFSGKMGIERGQDRVEKKLKNFQKKFFKIFFSNFVFSKLLILFVHNMIYRHR